MLAAGTLHAQGPTGKIEGQVHDPAGTPLSEAQVHIVGTTFGVLTDSHGHYFINNVPAGRYDLRAAYVGYRPIEARDLRVLAGQTTTQEVRYGSPVTGRSVVGHQRGASCCLQRLRAFTQ
ncbi:MAG: carboxypeptidase-like regulatory domain-containing protein [Gemmatimonadales bacterium]